MWSIGCFSFIVACLFVVGEGYMAQRQGYNPCWYTFCPIGTTCVVQKASCYGWSCPSYARCVRVREGYCPWASQAYSYLPCMNQCSLDVHCPGEEKCCKIGRCKRCVDAVDSPWDRTVTSESASDSIEDMMEEN